MFRRIIDHPFQLLSATANSSPDELKLVFSFLLSYPLAGLLKRIPDAKPQRKNLFIICTSVFYLVGLFTLWSGLWTLFVSAGGTYCIAKYLRGSPYMPWIGFIFVMGHMSINHIWRQAADTPSTVDITGAQMVLVMKMSAFCWNVADGQLSNDRLSDFQKDRALRELPPILDYVGYVLFFPSLLAGPSFDFTEYRRWITTSMFDVPAEIDPAKRPPVRKQRRIPRSGTPAAMKALRGFLWLGLFIGLSGRYNPDVLLSDSFSEFSSTKRIWFLYVVSLVARFKYYAVWSLAEGSCILAGLGYNGVDAQTGKVSWNRLQNIDPWTVEFAQNPRAYLAGWNMNTNNWLRNYVYLRVTPKGKKPGFRASFITFATSAFWHGFYPGYYLSFILASLIQTAAKNFRRHVRPFFLDPVTGAALPSKKFYDIASYVATQLTFSFATAPFLVLSFAGSIRVWSQVYFYGFAWTVASLLFFASPGKAELRKRFESREGRTRAKFIRTLSSESLSGKEPILGISKDPERDISEAVEEFKAEMEARQKQKKQ